MKYMITPEKKVSVILPVYNAASYLQETIKSVLIQSYENFELIIIDDCSKDNSLQIAQENACKDCRIKVLANTENKGVSLSRNRGIRESSGDYIAFLDSDDIWVNDKLERQLALLAETGARFVCGSYDFIDESGAAVLKPHLAPPQLSLNTILKENIILTSTVCIEASLLKGHQFRTDYYHEDYVLWLELLSTPLIAYGDREILTHYRLAKGSRSYNKIHAAVERWRIYRQFLKMNVLRSLFYFAQYALNGVRKYYT
ncbi:MAG: glycosyltransferase family 2 protein [Clostridia bacterium]|nr:glycosyltransferase family 2 protein [Clostridia bacterium]